MAVMRDRIKNINMRNLVLSLLAALAMWFFVVYNVNPTTTRTYNDVEIAFTNEESLTTRDLAIASANITTVDVTLEGKRTALDEVTSDSIIITADLSDVYLGENTVNLEITVPSDTALESISDQTVTVTIDDRETKTVEVVVVTDDDSAAKPLVSEQSATEVEVSGAESVIDSVESAILVFPSDKLTDEDTTLALSVHAADSDGNYVDFVDTDPDKISVTASSSTVKTVTLRVSATGTATGSYSRTYTAPETVEIKGKASDLANISSVTANVDLSNVTESGTVEVEVDLPDGVMLANSSRHVLIDVIVSSVTSESVTISASSISVSGLGSGLSGSVDEDITITVTGTADELSGLQASDFTVSVDASGLEAGSHSVSVSVTSTKYDDYTVSPSSVTLTIE